MTDSLSDQLLLEADAESRILSVASWLEPLLTSNGVLAGTPLSPGWLAPEEWKQLLQTMDGEQASLLLTRIDGIGIAANVRVTARQNGPGIALTLQRPRRPQHLLPQADQRSQQTPWCWDLLRDAIFERNLQGLVESWNSAAESLFGIAASSALGRNRFKLLTTAFPTPLTDIEAQLHQTGSWSATLTHRLPDGHELRTTSQWVLRRGAGGETLGVVEIHCDLGDPVLAMRESSFFAELHGALFESEDADELAERALPLLASHFGWQAAELWRFDPPGMIASPAENVGRVCTLAARWLTPDIRDQEDKVAIHPGNAKAWTRDEFPSQPRWSHPSPLAPATFVPWRTRLIVPLRSATQEMGVLVFASLNSRPEDPRIGTQLAQIGVHLGQWFHRHISEQRMRRSEERFRALLESAPDALVITDERGVITMANRQTERLFGWPREQLLGKMIEMLVPMHSRHRHIEHRERYAVHPRTRPMGAGLDLSALRADGSEFPVEISLSPIQIEGQTLVAASIRDASERRDMERTQRRLHQLEMAQAEHLATVGQLAAGMAHEIKNPLAGMSAALEVLASQNDLPATATEIMGEIQHQATRIRKIVDELLNYARPRPAELIRADLNITVEQAVPFAMLQAQARGVRLQVQTGAISPVLHDPEQIHRLVLNLLINAIDASHSGGCVDLITALAADGHTATVTVRDEGVGIAQADLERVFIPFFTTKGSRGTGLGLSLCRRIAEIHGGTIRVVSAVGQGSTFTLALPVPSETETQTIPGAGLAQTKDSDRG